MRNAHIVILGGTGFVGSHLVPRLYRDGHRITILSRNADLHREPTVVPRVAVRNCDVHDRRQLARELKGADAAINLVGILNEKGRSGKGFERAHVQLAETLIGACTDAGVRRLVQMSALNAGRGDSHYLRTKGEAEERVRGSGLDWTIFQPSVIFGRGDGLFERFAGLLKLTPVLPLARAGSKFAPVYVGDVAEAFAHAFTDPVTIGEIYELYGPDVMTLRAIVRYTADQLGLSRWIIPLPDSLGRLQALVGEFIPGKPISLDNFRSLKLDSVGGIDGLYRLGIDRTPVAAIVPDMLAGPPRMRRLDRDRARAARG